MISHLPFVFFFRGTIYAYAVDMEIGTTLLRMLSVLSFFFSDGWMEWDCNQGWSEISHLRTKVVSRTPTSGRGIHRVCTYSVESKLGSFCDQIESINQPNKPWGEKNSLPPKSFFFFSFEFYAGFSSFFFSFALFLSLACFRSFPSCPPPLF